jgi:hypothetical protein
MDYSNSQTKLEVLVQYFNESRMNLTPIFQRPRVWPIRMRRELIKNIVNGRPIPAIFMYKDVEDVSGSAFKFNILDGKQRLDSVVLFLASDAGSSRFGVKNWKDYIVDPLYRRDAKFSVDFGDKKKKSFLELNDTTVAKLREYMIPTIQIELNENTSLNELIMLFVDINQYGVRVNRNNIVRALKKSDPLLKDIYDMIATREKRRRDVLTKRKSTPFTAVLKNLKIVSSVADKAIQADKMWEKLLELALFVRSGGNHRKPTEILKSFIKKPDSPEKLSKSERAALTKAFVFLSAAYNESPSLRESRLATDQTHFYTMATTLVVSDLVEKDTNGRLVKKLTQFASLIDKGVNPDDPPSETPLDKAIARYRLLSTEKTTDATRRKERQQEMVKALVLM